MEAILEVKNITKTFSGVTALSDVNMSLEKGKVTALIGENGAGKSTLLKIMSGIHTDYKGDILFDSKKLLLSNPKEAQEIGISIIHQELNLIPQLSVAQNIFLGREIINSFGFLDQEKMNQIASELLTKLKLDIDPTTRIRSLKVGQQQIVEIAKALLVDSEIIFMDEPTSAIGESEVEILFQIINELKTEGKSLVYISHKLDELFAIADHYVVLRDGEVVGSGAMTEMTREKMVHLMAGRDVVHSIKSGKNISNEPILEVKNLGLKNPENPDRPLLKHIDFSLHKGEVLGIYGLMGAGRTELCESLFGLNSSVNGTILLNGQHVNFKNPGQAMKAGIALVPEDRKQDGIVPGLAVSKNMSLTVLDKILKMGFLNKKSETRLYEKYVDALKIKVNSEEQLIKNLSGGNQQKVVLAKWMEINPKVLMLDEPTRGIDVNAKNEIYDLVQKLSDSGVSIIVVSSEIPEVLAISDRILVMSEGEITAEFTRSEATEDRLMNACIPQNEDV